MNPTRPSAPLFLLFLYVIGCVSMAFGQGTEADISKCWSYGSGDLRGSVLAADSGHIYVGAVDGRVEAVSIEGKKIWQSDFGGSISSDLLPLNTGLLVVTSTVTTDPAKPTVSTLRSLSKETGILNWGVALPAADRFYLSSFNGSVMVVSGEGAIHSVDPATGQMRWDRQIGARVVIEPVMTSTKLIVATDTKKLLTISPTTGAIDAQLTTRFRPTAVLQRSQDEIIVGDERGNVTVFIGRTAVSWQFRSGGEISALFRSGDNILAASHDNFIYLLAGSNGSIVWKKRVSGRLAEIAKIGDRYVLMSAIDDNNAVLTNLSDGKVAGQIAFNTDEKLTYEPVMVEQRIYVLTNRSLNAYSLDGCSQNAPKAANLTVSGL